MLTNNYDSNAVRFDKKTGRYYTPQRLNKESGARLEKALASGVGPLQAITDLGRNYLDGGPAGGQSAAASVLLDETESAGIDPETGREQFRKKKLGSTTSAAMLGA